MRACLPTRPLRLTRTWSCIPHLTDLVCNGGSLLGMGVHARAVMPVPVQSGPWSCSAGARRLHERAHRVQGLRQVRVLRRQARHVHEEGQARLRIRRRLQGQGPGRAAGGGGGR
jgi:hypothetical protein